MNKKLKIKERRERRSAFDLKTLSLSTCRKAGFTLLFASLIVSLLLAVGLAILDITFQQYLLSSAGRESQFAFYNADTGLECALYYDKNAIGGKHFAKTPADLNDPLSYHPGESITCANQGNQSGTIDDVIEDAPNGSMITYFNIILDPSQCPNNPGETFSIKVVKTADPVVFGNFYTVIQSRGYNTCDLSSQKRVERGLQADY